MRIPREALVGDPFGRRIPRAAMVGDPFFPAILAAFGAVKTGVAAIQKARGKGQAPTGGAASQSRVDEFVRSLPPAARGRATAITQRGTGVTATARAVPPSSSLVGGRMLPPSRAAAGPGAPRRYKRMRVANVKALRRAMRRVQGFAKLAKQTITFTHQVKMKARRKR